MAVILRKMDNNTITTTPNKIKETLGAELAKKLNLYLQKIIPPFVNLNHNINFNKELEKAMNQYNELFKELVDI